MAKNKTAETPQAEPTATETPQAAPGTIGFNSYGYDWTIRAPYAEGHVCNKPEAMTLNQTRLENIRNNQASGIKEMSEKVDALRKLATSEERGLTEDETAQVAKLVQDVRDALEKYDAAYVFQGKRAPRVVTNPVERRARQLARDIITTALSENNMKPNELEDGAMDDLIDQYLAANPEVTEEARKQLEAVKAAAGAGLSGVNLAALKKKPTETPTEEAPAGA